MKGLVTTAKNTLVLDNNLPMPTAKVGEVLVRVQYAAVSSFDLELISGKYDLLSYWAGGKHPVKSGLEFSGLVESDGQYFSKGDTVFGYVDILSGPKTHAEYLAVSESYIAHIPTNMSPCQMAALPMGALTALVALRDIANLNAGQKILITGASGGVGVYAIQLAKMLGAHITAFAGSYKLDTLKGLGANRIINYHTQDISKLDEKFDAIFDLAISTNFAKIQHLLKPNGIFIPADPFSDIGGFIRSIFQSKKTRYLMVAHGEREGLTQIAQWAADGFLRPVIEEVYSLENFDTAFQRIGQKGRQGKIILEF